MLAKQLEVLPVRAGKFDDQPGAVENAQVGSHGSTLLLENVESVGSKSKPTLPNTKQTLPRAKDLPADLRDPPLFDISSLNGW